MVVFIFPVTYITQWFVCCHLVCIFVVDTTLGTSSASVAAGMRLLLQLSYAIILTMRRWLECFATSAMNEAMLWSAFETLALAIFVCRVSAFFELFDESAGFANNLFELAVLDTSITDIFLLFEMRFVTLLLADGAKG